MSLLEVPDILLPISGIDLNKWSVIACDQFTSEIDYWNQVHHLVDNVPSTYHLILPEAYLDAGFEARIRQVNENMALYLRTGLFQKEKGLVLVKRTTPYQPQRLGLVVAIDLDEYEYLPGKSAKIVASEKTVPERIPPRVLIRENAPIELPHVLVLADDSEGIIASLGAQRAKYRKLYDFELNMDGGSIQGFLIEDATSIIERLEAMAEKSPLIVGDGNHSLAAAKVCWENIKAQSDANELSNHPARYAMVELMSIYEPGLAFEPIHRVVFDPDDDFLEALHRASYGSDTLSILMKSSSTYALTPDSPFSTIEWVQEFLDDYLKAQPKTILDYVHGTHSLKKIIESEENAIGIVLPPLQRDQLFPYIKNHGVLPRKSFSLGEAVEKRYYLEARLIQKERR